MADDSLNSQSENTPSDTAIQTEEQIISENPWQTLVPEQNKTNRNNGHKDKED